MTLSVSVMKCPKSPTLQKAFLTIIIIVVVIILAAVLYASSLTKQHSIDFSNFINFNSDADFASTRICCLILTTPKNFVTRAKVIHETWAPRCDRHFFVTEDPPAKMTPEQRNVTRQIPIAPIEDITPGYHHLTQKSTLAFLFAYENLVNEYDWFVKADDDTYLIVENLKMFLSKHNPSKPVTFGYNFKVLVSKGYHSGGASYVLSQEALRRFHKAHKEQNLNCSKDGGTEDVDIAKCLRSVDVYPGKALDEQNRELFHPLTFIDHFRGSFPNWLPSYAENPLQSSYNCCSDRTISFHYVSPDELYLIDFLLYNVRPIPKITISNSSMTAVKKYYWKGHRRKTKRKKKSKAKKPH